MNIFWLSHDIQKNVQYHVNRHSTKMIVEYAQLLSSVHHTTLSPYEPKYKLTHKNHPCAIWARESLSNYMYLGSLAKALCREYTFRYGKIHKTESIIDELRENLPLIADKGLSLPPLAMPEKYHSDNYVEAYRQYYINEKSHIASWKKRDIPYWFKEAI